jgi:hypothetical protein
VAEPEAEHCGILASGELVRTLSKGRLLGRGHLTPSGQSPEEAFFPGFYEARLDRLGRINPN